MVDYVVAMIKYLAFIIIALLWSMVPLAFGYHVYNWFNGLLN